MRRTSLAGLALAIVILDGLAHGRDGGSAGAPTRHRMEGTWDLIEPKPAKTRHVKFINKDHFVTIDYDLQSRLALSAVGGSAAYSEGSYREVVEFGSMPKKFLEDGVGLEQVYETTFLDKDRVRISGTNPTTRITWKETWARVEEPEFDFGK